VDKKAPADLGAGMDLDPGQDAPDMADKASGEMPAPQPQPVRQAVQQERLKTGIAQDDLGARPGGRVAVESGVNFIAQVFEKHRGHYVIVMRSFANATGPRTSAAPLAAGDMSI